MATSLVILGARAACIGEYIMLGSKVSLNPTSRSASAPRHQNDEVIAKKLVIPARIFYALFLWCMKLCLLCFYSRLSAGLSSFERATFILRICLAVSFIAILFPTLLECRPMSLYWNNLPEGNQCREARANLITMGVFNILTDLALIAFPIPIVWKSAKDPRKRLRLGILFSGGFLVVFITITRLPLTLRGSVPQSIRSLWADIEIACACLVANASFYYPFAKEVFNGHPVTSDGGPRRNPGSQQLEVSRRPSNPNPRDAEEEMILSNMAIKELEAGEWTCSKSGTGCRESFENAHGASVLHIETLPQIGVLDTSA